MSAYQLTNVRLPKPVYDAMVRQAEAYRAMSEAAQHHELVQAYSNDDWLTLVGDETDEVELNRHILSEITAARDAFDRAHFAFHAAADELSRQWLSLTVFP